MAMIGKYKNINLKKDSTDPKYIVKVFDHRERILPVGKKYQEWHDDQNILLNKAELESVYATKKVLERELENNKKTLKGTAIQSIIMYAFCGICLIISTNDFINTQSQQALKVALASGALETFFIAIDVGIRKRIINLKNELEKTNNIIEEENISKKTR